MDTALHQAGHLPFSCLLWASGISVVPVSGAFSLEATLIPRPWPLGGVWPCGQGSHPSGLLFHLVHPWEKHRGCVPEWGVRVPGTHVSLPSTPGG